MTCCLDRKHINLVLFWKIFTSYIYVSVDYDTINNFGKNLTCRVCKLENIVTKLLKGNQRSWDIGYFTIFSKIWEFKHTEFPSEFSLCHYPLKHRYRHWKISWKSTEFWILNSETTSHEFRLNVTRDVEPTWRTEAFGWAPTGMISTFPWICHEFITFMFILNISPDSYYYKGMLNTNPLVSRFCFFGNGTVYCCLYESHSKL